MIQEYYILVNRIDSSTTLRFAQNDNCVSIVIGILKL